MADDDEAGLQPEHELLEALEPGEVEVVGRLVEQEDVVAAEQDAGQRRPGRLPAGQRRGLGVEQADGQAEVRADLLGAHVEVGAAEVEPAGQRLVVVAARARRSVSASVAASSAACAAATPVRRARKAVSVSPGRRSGSCGSRPTVAVGGASGDACRSRAASAPASVASRVDLPAPLGPTTPIRLRGATVSETPGQHRARGRARR